MNPPANELTTPDANELTPITPRLPLVQSPRVKRAQHNADNRVRSVEKPPAASVIPRSPSTRSLSRRSSSRSTATRVLSKRHSRRSPDLSTAISSPPVKAPVQPTLPPPVETAVESPGTEAVEDPAATVAVDSPQNAALNAGHTTPDRGSDRDAPTPAPVVTPESPPSTRRDPGPVQYQSRAQRRGSFDVEAQPLAAPEKIEEIDRTAQAFTVVSFLLILATCVVACVPGVPKEWQNIMIQANGQFFQGAATNGGKGWKWMGSSVAQSAWIMFSIVVYAVLTHVAAAGSVANCG